MIAVAISTWQISAGGIGALLKTAAAIYSLRRMVPSAAAAVRVRRSSDNAEADAPFTATGDLDQTALLEFTNAARPLDTVTGAAAAYSLRKLRTAYAGSAIRVRRSSDNAEADIGFTTAGDLDTVALLAHCGAGNGFVTTWYDQTTNTRNAIQATAANQPRMVNAGVVETVSGRPAIFTTAGLSMSNAGAFLVTGNADRELNAVLTRQSGATMNVWSGVHASNGAWGIDLGTPSTYAPYTYGAGDAISAAVANGATVIVTASRASGTSRGFVNGAARTTDSDAISTVVGVGIGIGVRPDGIASTGHYSEVVYFPTALSTTDRTLLEQSQAVYYGITHATALPSGFVTTWYDQSTNARNATQATAGLQPRIVNAGTVELKDGKPCIRNHVSDAVLNSWKFAEPSTNWTFNAVASRDTAGVNANDCLGTDGGGYQGSGIYIQITNDGIVANFNRPGGYVSVAAPLTIAAGQNILATVVHDSSNNATVFANGNASTSATGISWASGSLSVFNIGQYNPAVFVSLLGTYQELVSFPSALTTTDRQILERNEGAYYGVAVA